METEIVEAKKSDRGFTLVELLIVIVILGILATVTVFAVRGITDQGKTSACKADKNTLETAAEAHMAQFGTYPATQAGLVTAGFMRAVTTNFSYTLIPAVVGPPAVPANYTLTGLSTAQNNCVGI
ncbi:MAG: prepilin-type N-terminal cleavage/methylation domain-containing protein [Ilumatobacteraceae bacterium]|nr:prepilin-type N-terminal cleavage/methylation domain-containing protein [Ilumatobacteraceae bacterium]